MDSVKTVKMAHSKRIKLETGYKAIILPNKEEVSSMTLQQFDERVKSLANLSTLTVEETQYITACRRVLRNKQYKRESRDRLKQRLTSTDTTIEILTHELKSLHDNCATLMALNMSLVAELNKYRMMDPLMPRLCLQSDIEWF